jgi:hypothetical protein
MNTIEFLTTPWTKTFSRFLTLVERDALFVSPYITEMPLRTAQDSWADRDIAGSVRVTIVTNLSPDNLLQGALDPAALLTFVQSVSNTVIIYLPSVHAKVYVADDKAAIVTSANLTDGGLLRNHEYGVLMTNAILVKRVRADLERFATLGNSVPMETLRELVRTTVDLRDIHKRAERSVRKSLRSEFLRRMGKTKLELMAVRAHGKTTHRIFAETILYLLDRGPLRTVELHPQIQRIHPDLCDDSIDRVIDGVHFGKKWKHHIRNAQQHLKRMGLIEFDGERWRRTEKPADPSLLG